MNIEARQVFLFTPELLEHFQNENALEARLQAVAYKRRTAVAALINYFSFKNGPRKERPHCCQRGPGFLISPKSGDSFSITE